MEPWRALEDCGGSHRTSCEDSESLMARNGSEDSGSLEVEALGPYHLMAGSLEVEALGPSNKWGGGAVLGSLGPNKWGGGAALGSLGPNKWGGGGCCGSDLLCFF